MRIVAWRLILVLPRRIIIAIRVCGCKELLLFRKSIVKSILTSSRIHQRYRNFVDAQGRLPVLGFVGIEILLSRVWFDDGAALFGNKGCFDMWIIVEEAHVV